MLNKVDIEYMILLRKMFSLSRMVIVFSFKVSWLTFLLILAISIFVWIVYLCVRTLLQRNCNHRHAMIKDEYARMRERQIKSLIRIYTTLDELKKIELARDWSCNWRERGMK